MIFIRDRQTVACKVATGKGLGQNGNITTYIRNSRKHLENEGQITRHELAALSNMGFSKEMTSHTCKHRLETTIAVL